MQYKIRDIIDLSDGNKYEITSKTDYKNETYYLLIDMNNDENLKFCLEKIINDEIELEEIEDAELIKILLPLLGSAAADLFNN